MNLQSRWWFHKQYLSEAEPADSLNALRRARDRRGISDVMASIISIAITLIAGFSVFSYVNTQAAVQERQLGSAYGSTVNFLQERFVVVNANFSSSAVTIWIYNNGAIDLTLSQVFVYNSTRSLYVLFNATKIVNLNTNTVCSSSSPLSEFRVPMGYMKPITLSLSSCGLSFSSGRLYTLTVLAVYGNVVTYSQVR